MKKLPTKPIHINKDIWFYVNPKSFHFVVWQEINGKNIAVMFNLTHKKIKRFLT